MLKDRHLNRFRKVNKLPHNLMTIKSKTIDGFSIFSISSRNDNFTSIVTIDWATQSNKFENEINLFQNKNISKKITNFKVMWDIKKNKLQCNKSDLKFSKHSFDERVDDTIYRNYLRLKTHIASRNRDLLYGGNFASKSWHFSKTCE